MTDSPRPAAPSLIPIPASCENCGTPLAWRVGVGRYVISHRDGQDRCSLATARLADADLDAAAMAYRQADAEFARAIEDRRRVRPVIHHGDCLDIMRAMPDNTNRTPA